MRRTLIDAGNGGSESRAVTGSASVRPSASPKSTSSAPSTGVRASTAATASGIEIILYLAAAIVDGDDEVQGCGGC